jgi:uncharacterized protein (TIGR00369 family)
MQLFGATIPFAEHCGIEEVGFSDGRTQIRLVLAPHHANNVGIAHGGVICTLIDIAMGSVARSTLGRPVITLDMQTSFLSPGRGTLIAEGRILRAGMSIVFCEADVRTEDGTLVAKGSGVFKPTRTTTGPSDG